MHIICDTEMWFIICDKGINFSVIESVWIIIIIKELWGVKNNITQI